FLRSTDNALHTMGQITSYSTAQYWRQPRLHLFSVLFLPSAARLLRWDRAGVIVTELIPIDDPKLAEFFWRFNLLSPEQRGHDPSVRPAREEEQMAASTAIKAAGLEEYA
ncbi:hypothetical protein K488DRAFT_24691, partial [Vararia minispora EC-137]